MISPVDMEKAVDVLTSQIGERNVGRADVLTGAETKHIQALYFRLVMFGALRGFLEEERDSGRVEEYRKFGF